MLGVGYFCLFKLLQSDCIRCSQIAVSTIRYLVELRGWNGICLPAVHSRDAKIYIDDPGPWIMGLATEARYSVRPAPEVCVCDL
jgi:EEF1A N-terminal glycine/lysine methyltransferase